MIGRFAKAAVALVLAVLLAACGGTASSLSTAGSALPSHGGRGTASATPAAGPSGLPCNPQDSSCWLPDTAPYPQEEFISYKPAHSYPSAFALAKVLTIPRSPCLPGASIEVCEGTNGHHRRLPRGGHLLRAAQIAGTTHKTVRRVIAPA